MIKSSCVYQIKEVIMNATPSNQLNEFVIFQAFTQNQSFTHALKDIRKHNKTVPDDKKIDTQSKNNVDALRLSFGVFKKAEQKLLRKMIEKKL